MKKYKLTEERNGNGLYRIQALIDIPLIRVKVGDLGGWIESEKNLSHDDNCWVFGNGQVFGNGRVYDSGQVYGDGRVCGKMVLTRKALVIDGLSQHTITVADNLVSVGCEVHAIQDWILKAEIIGLKHGYTSRQIAEYLSTFKYIEFMMTNYRKD